MSDIAQSGEALIAAADPDEGWGFFRHAQDPGLDEKQQRLADEKTRRLALIASIMWTNDPHFRELIEFIFDQTLRRPAHVAQLGLPMDQAYGYGCFREGQNTVAQMIVNMIAAGRKGTGANDANTTLADGNSP